MNAYVKDPALAPRRRARRAARALQRGVTLIEILIVLAIIGLIAGGVAVAALPQFKKAQVSTTRNSAQQLQKAAEFWRTTNGNECPTAEKLKADKQIDSTAKLSDAWDMPFKIICDDDDTTVVSFGPDKKEGTADDIRVPEATAAK